MRAMRPALLVLTAACLGAAPAASEITVDGRTIRVALDGADGLAFTAADGRLLGTLRAPAPLGHLPEIDVVHAERDLYLHARLPRGAGAVELVGRFDGERVVPVYAGMTGPQGDGERAERLRVDGAGVLRYQTSPGVARCDGDDVLFPALYDPRQGRFRGVTIAPPDGAPLAASPTPPAGARGRPLGMFRFVAASTMKGDEGRADRLGAPRELEDGRADTTWI